MMIFWILDVLCFDYYIKMPGTEKYLQGVINVSTPPFFGPKITRHTFKIVNDKKYKNKKTIYVNELPKQVLDVAKINNKLIIYPDYNSENQKFELQMVNTTNQFRISYRNGCIEWNPLENYLFLSSCTRGGDYQEFIFECVDCNGEIVEGRDYDGYNDKLKYGFYDESTMSSLSSMKKMLQEMITCFNNNGVCGNNNENSLKKCRGLFDPNVTVHDNMLESDKKSDRSILGDIHNLERHAFNSTTNIKDIKKNDLLPSHLTDNGTGSSAPKQDILESDDKKDKGVTASTADESLLSMAMKGYSCARKWSNALKKYIS